MYCLSFEKNSFHRGSLNAEREELLWGKDSDKDTGPLSRYMNAGLDKSEHVDAHGFADPFRKAGGSVLDPGHDMKDTVAPTLHETARMWYEREKSPTKYVTLQSLLERQDASRFRSLWEYEVEQVYRDVLRAADVLVTTPVTASKFSKFLGPVFRPALVIFDEAPHARELSIMISIAKFDPEVWLLTGDHRQTKPFVGSHARKPAVNKYVEQLRVSTMERAHMANPKMPSLLVNHRAHGNLQMLASKLFYQGQMIPARDPGEPGALPPSTLHLRQKYIMPLKRNKGSEVSRLVVVLRDTGPPESVQTSWYHPEHQRWTMRLVSKLLQDPQFLHTNGKDPGSILIMSPYRQALFEYRKAIKELKRKFPEHEKRIVEPRTVDTAQGYEADFVVLDLVRDW